VADEPSTWDLPGPAPVAVVTWMLVAGPVEAEPVRRWLGQLPLDLGDRSLYDAADALVGGRDVRGRFSPPGGAGLPVRFAVDGHGLTMELDGPAADDPWWAALVTDAGRTLKADTVALVDDPSALLPCLLWVSTTALGDFADARARAMRVERQWDSALLLHR
jgi:hypothetical protein